jgi:hypothetical protein
MPKYTAINTQIKIITPVAARFTVMSSLPLFTGFPAIIQAETS